MLLAGGRGERYRATTQHPRLRTPRHQQSPNPSQPGASRPPGGGLSGACALAPRPGAGRPHLPGGERQCRAVRGMRGGHQAPPPRSAGAEAAGTSKPRRKPPLPAARRRPPSPAAPGRTGCRKRPGSAEGTGRHAPRAHPRPWPETTCKSLPSRGGRGRGDGGSRLERRRGRGHDPLARAGGRAGAGSGRPSPAGGPGARAPRMKPLRRRRRGVG